MKIFFTLLAALATLGTAAAQSGGSPMGTAPNYKPNGGGKTTGSAGKGQTVRSGGQGHNSTPDPKGKTMVAPTTPTHQNKRTGSTNPTPGSH